jgi:Domain of unknown function (DUF4124)
MTERVGALVLTAALIVARPASAEVHRWVDARGIVHYTDRVPDSPAPAAVAMPVERATKAPAPRAPRAPMTLDALFELTGTGRQVTGLTRRLAREFRPAKGQLPTSAEATIERVVARTFTAEAVMRLTREEFARGLDGPKLEAKLGWLRSPLGHRIAALEMTTGEPDQDRLLAEFARQLTSTPASERRRQLIERLDWVSGGSDVSADIAAALSASIARAVAARTPGVHHISRRQIDSQTDEIRTTTAGRVRQATGVSMLYTYRTLTDEELERYVEFESTEAGRWYNGLLRRALLAVLTRVFEETAQAVFAAVPPERWSRAGDGE